MSWTAGLAYEASERLTFVFDVRQILYSGIKSVNNPIDPAALTPVLSDGSPNPNHIPLGADNGSGFGWEDMTIFKLGAEYKASEDWTCRAGYSYGEQPIPDSEVIFNILAPGIVEHHLTLVSREVGLFAL